MNTRPRETSIDPEETAEVPGSLPCAGSLLVEKFAPREVGVGESFRYRVRVTNLSEAPVSSVVLIESLISLIHVTDSTPRPQSMEPHSVRWVLEPIWPGESRSVVLDCVAQKRLWFRSHTSVSYSLGT